MESNKIAVEQVLANLKIDKLNDMQLASIEANRKHKDVLLLSATGSGKTIAYLLPILEQLDPSSQQTQALIIVPTRELAQQIEQVFRAMGTGLKITSCYGGHSREVEDNNLKQPPAILVGTPGRLTDHFERGNITADAIKTLVLDEFDKSLEMGFDEQMIFILRHLSNINKRILTSATDAVEIPDFVELKHYQRLDFLTKETAVPTLEIKTVDSPEKDKTTTLFRLLCHLGANQSIVFCNHRESVERTSEFLTGKGIINTFYHGGLEQQDRDSALCKFRNGSADVLVTTDLGSRGLDIPDVRYIIHYHLPPQADPFIHRNGRTARMGAEGTAIMILSQDEHVPSYVGFKPAKMELPEEVVLPPMPKWITLFIAAGKKDKVNKIDIVGFLAQKGQLKKEEIGLIEVKDYSSFVAVRLSKAENTLKLVRNEKIKNQKVRIDVAK